MCQSCPEPHHAHTTDEVAHKKHHWRERLICLSFCTFCHVVYEVGSYLMFNHHH